MNATRTVKTIDTDAICFAWAPTHETVTRRPGEGIEDFCFRACQESGWATSIRLANIRGGVLATADCCGVMIPR